MNFHSYEYWEHKKPQHRKSHAFIHLQTSALSLSLSQKTHRANGMERECIENRRDRKKRTRIEKGIGKRRKERKKKKWNRATDTKLNCECKRTHMQQRFEPHMIRAHHHGEHCNGAIERKEMHGKIIIRLQNILYVPYLPICIRESRGASSQHHMIYIYMGDETSENVWSVVDATWFEQCVHSHSAS